MEVSILLLCWNHEKYIEQCLTSIFAQTYKEFEIIFLDNTSTDKSYQIAERTLESSGFSYKIYRNESPKSVAENANFLLDKAAGKYVFPFSTDDWMAAKNVECKFALLKANPRVGYVFGGGWYYLESTDTFVEVDVTKFRRENMLTNLFINRTSYFHPGTAYKKAVIYEVGKWDESLLIEDLDLNLRIVMKYEVDFTKKPLVYYRKHSSSFLSNYQLTLKGFLQYCEKYRDNKTLPLRKWMSDNYKFFSYQAVDDNNYTLALKFYYKSFLLNPRITVLLGVGCGLLRKCFSRIEILKKMWDFIKYGHTRNKRQI